MYGWRLPFLIVGIPALAFAVLIVFTTVEPSRGGKLKLILKILLQANTVHLSYRPGEGVSRSATAPTIGRCDFIPAR